MRRLLMVVVPVLLVFALSATPALASVDEDVLEAQQTMNELMPRIDLAEDGIDGPRTQQALCGLRRLYGHSDVHRGSLTAADLEVLRSNGALTTPNHGDSYISVDRTCQLVYLAQGGEWVAVMAASTGRAGQETPVMTNTVDWKRPGWHTSSLYPASEPNMYNTVYYHGPYAIHGSHYVPPYPASAGCVRLSPADADFVFERVHPGMFISVYGSF